MFCTKTMMENRREMAGGERRGASSEHVHIARQEGLCRLFIKKMTTSNINDIVGDNNVTVSQIPVSQQTASKQT